MKSSVLALALAAGMAALPVVAFCAIQFSRPESTHHRTQVKPQLRGTKDDEHRVGGRKPSFGYQNDFPGLIQDVDQSRWAIECLQNWQIVGALPTSTEDIADANAGFSNYNLISQPSGLCTDTLACAFENFCPAHFTHAEREELCVSVQEMTWGTDGLAKLEAIKAKVDPQGLFQCQKCVGFKGPVRDY